MVDAWPQLHRRRFVIHLGRLSAAVAVFGLTACATSESTDRPSPSPTVGSGGQSAGPAGALTWQRVNLGFVSAYVLARDGEAAVVDTGVAGSGDDIAASLRALGLDWAAVGHVILTHRHSDHVGGAGDVLALAPDASAYAGAADVAAISVPRPLVAVGDGDDVFGLHIVATPGHTAGHISVLDPAGGILVAGDALNTSGGDVSGSNPQFTDDASAAEASVRRLAGLVFETLLVGHGEPILTGADRLVQELAASL